MSARHFTTRLDRFPRRISSCAFLGRRPYLGRLRKSRSLTTSRHVDLRSASYRRRFPAASKPLHIGACALPSRICAGIGGSGRRGRVASNWHECPVVDSWSVDQQEVRHEL